MILEGGKAHNRESEEKELTTRRRRKKRETCDGATGLNVRKAIEQDVIPQFSGILMSVISAATSVEEEVGVGQQRQRQHLRLKRG